MSSVNPAARLINEDGSARDRIGGFETEYGFSCSTRHMSSDVGVAAMATAVEVGCFLDNQFQETGERIYLDQGMHPEFSTAEELSFAGAAERVLVGHVKMAGLYEAGAAKAKRKYEPTLKHVNLIANTTDGVGGSSWASHENYLARRELKPDDYILPLAVHHLSRIVWSGSGFPYALRSGPGFRFFLSEKAEYIWDIANTSTTTARPLVNLRDVSYADDSEFRRIHIVSGESIFSPFANALRLASGSIVLRACELGVDFSDLMPENPVRAIREISHDPDLAAEVRLENGKKFRGLDLQRAIAERAITAATEADYITEQEVEWGKNWIQVCDDLDKDPDSCADRVDWVVKRKLIDRELEAKRGSAKSDADLAWAKSVDYHRLLPAEGMGMKLVRKGYFRGSPSEEVLEQGLPLPPTRASVRGEGLRRLNEIDRYETYAGWDYIGIGRKSMKIILNDPYDTDTERLDSYINSTAA
jgi:Pup amidohydrolase